MARESIRGIGYQGKELSDVVALLNQSGVDTVVDVRLNAISRKKGFSKTALRQGLEAAGILYVHLPQLGNPKGNRAGFWEPKTLQGALARERFRDLLENDSAEWALREIESLVSGGSTVALLCFEHDQDQCHRQEIIDCLAQRQMTLV